MVTCLSCTYQWFNNFFYCGMKRQEITVLCLLINKIMYAFSLAQWKKVGIWRILNIYFMYKQVDFSCTVMLVVLLDCVFLCEGSSMQIFSDELNLFLCSITFRVIEYIITNLGFWLIKFIQNLSFWMINIQNQV